MQSAPTIKVRDTYLTRAQLAQHLNRSTRYVDRLREEGKIPYYRVTGRTILFKLEDVERLLAERRVDPAIELGQQGRRRKEVTCD